MTRETQAMDDNERWQAVSNRDGQMDGTFVYAVRSTGIFCRPSCPSRKADRRNVRYFDLPEAAVQAGYRPCKRCRPERAETTDPRLGAVRRICQMIERGDGPPPTLSDLSAEVGLSPHHLQRVFKAAVGISPRQYAEAIRVSKCKMELRNGESVTSALYGAGYGSSSRLYEKAPAHFGMSPASYAKGGKGARIAYTVVDVLEDDALGKLMVAATDRGLCMVALGDSQAFLEDELCAEFPAAELRRDDKTLADWTRDVVAVAEGHAPNRELPLDVRATAFQWQVWDRLRRIPAGQTRTYREIATDLGKPGAARAVGRACATNPVSLVIPCHRAVGTDGALHGYRWGLPRKNALLEKERASQSS